MQKSKIYLIIVWAVSLILIAFAFYSCGKQEANKALESKRRIHAAEYTYSAEDSSHFLRIEQQLVQLDSMVYRQSIREVSFDSVLRTQTGLFAAIVTAALIFVGLFSYQIFYALVSDSRRAFHDKVEEMRKELDQQIRGVICQVDEKNAALLTKFDEIEKNINPIKVDLLDTQAKTYQQIADSAQAEQGFDAAFYFSVRAAHAFISARELSNIERQRKNYYSTIIVILNIAKEYLGKSDISKLAKSISAATVNLQKVLRQMADCDDALISKLCTEILAELNSKLEYFGKTSNEKPAE